MDNTQDTKDSDQQGGNSPEAQRPWTTLRRRTLGTGPADELAATARAAMEAMKAEEEKEKAQSKEAKKISEAIEKGEEFDSSLSEHVVFDHYSLAYQKILEVVKSINPTDIDTLQNLANAEAVFRKLLTIECPGRGTFLEGLDAEKLNELLSSIYGEETLGLLDILDVKIEGAVSYQNRNILNELTATFEALNDIESVQEIAIEALRSYGISLVSILQQKYFEFKDQGYNMLHIAAAYGEHDQVKFLLSVGKDPLDIYAPNKITPLDLAIGNFMNALRNENDIFQEDKTPQGKVRDSKPILETFFNHLKQNNIDIPKDLFSIQDQQQRNILHYLSVLPSVTQEQINSFVNSGAAVNQEDKDGNTPLHYAVRKENKDLVNALLHVGANPSIENVDGESPFSLARGDIKSDIEMHVQDQGVVVPSPPARANSTPEQVLKTLSGIDVDFPVIEEEEQNTDTTPGDDDGGDDTITRETTHIEDSGNAGVATVTNSPCATVTNTASNSGDEDSGPEDAYDVLQEGTPLEPYHKQQRSVRRDSDTSSEASSDDDNDDDDQGRGGSAEKVAGGADDSLMLSDESQSSNAENNYSSSNIFFSSEPVIIDLSLTEKKDGNATKEEKEYYNSLEELEQSLSDMNADVEYNKTDATYDVDLEIVYTQENTGMKILGQNLFAIDSAGSSNIISY